ncbi:SIR2 family protein [Achromobacter insuavis]|uniref:SIR2 family protein n=1 Tax=Achromobacter insuavis TaxID=1287735 RepID=UPI001F134E83|nr:SIR2 family protein [Achromobacter insuavis]
MDRQKFVRTYSEKLLEGSASAFVGAGLSMAAGYPSWKQLLADIADELDIDLDAESDLAGVAQWYINHQKKQRTQIGRVIAKAFPPVKVPPETLRVLARLPLRHLWTTNYDQLIEAAWDHAGKSLAVRTRPEQLSVPDPASHGTLYKMHGSVDDPSAVVIAKEDYELYRREKGAFFHLLTGHAIGMHFLFLGFSFTDANISHLFSLLREVLPDTPKEHYAIVKRPAAAQGRASAKTKERSRRELSRHRHWVADLQRYGIQCVEIDDYSEICDILKEVERRVSRTSVFVSGSYPEERTQTAEGRLVVEVSEGLGRLIGTLGCRLVSGFGLTVGSAAIAGRLGEVYKHKHVHLDSALLLRPFPQSIPKATKKDDFFARYREDLVLQGGICVVVGGIKKQNRQFAVAPGVIAEATIARSNGRPVVPLGFTGGAAQELWQQMRRLPAADRGGISDKDFEELGKTPTSVPAYLALVDKILKRLSA